MIDSIWVYDAVMRTKDADGNCVQKCRWKMRTKDSDGKCVQKYRWKMRTKDAQGKANSVGFDLIASSGVVRSGSVLYAHAFLFLSFMAVLTSDRLLRL